MVINSDQNEVGITARSEISVQSSWKRRRCTFVFVLLISCGVLLSVAIIPFLVGNTHELQAKTQQIVEAAKTTISTENITVTTTLTTRKEGQTDATKTTILSENGTAIFTTAGTAMYSWSEWSSWKPYNVTCGYGKQMRMRRCIVIHSKHYAMLCKGPSLQERDYRLTDCRDCNEWYHLGKKQSNGIYPIDPDTRGKIDVYCDMTTDGGGWTVFQRRQDGSEDFYRGWTDYKNGFGNLSGEFWLGNDNIHRLTRKPTSLRVDLQDWEMNAKYAKYRTFQIGSNLTYYKLKVNSFSGTLEDSLTTAHNDMKFSTKDKDHDISKDFNCAEGKHGAWWYSDCYDSNLNGLYMRNTQNEKAVTWYGFNNSFLALKITEMKLRSVV